MAFLSHTRTDCRPVPTRRASLLELLALYRQRRDLARLDDRALDDLGLTRDEANREARRWFWDTPAK